MNKKEIREYLEQFKPQLEERLREYLTPSEISLKDSLTDCINSYFGGKHIDVEAHATEEEIKESKVTVTMTALDEIGAETLKQYSKE